MVARYLHAALYGQGKTVSAQLGHISSSLPEPDQTETCNSENTQRACGWNPAGKANLPVWPIQRGYDGKMARQPIRTRRLFICATLAVEPNADLVQHAELKSATALNETRKLVTVAVKKPETGRCGLTDGLPHICRIVLLIVRGVKPIAAPGHRRRGFGWSWQVHSIRVARHPEQTRVSQSPLPLW